MFWILSLFLLYLNVQGKTISEGIDFESTYGKTVNSYNNFALHPSFSEVYLNNRYRLAKFENEPFKYINEVNGNNARNLHVINNQDSSFLLAVYQTPVSGKLFDVFDLSLSQVDTTSWNIPVFDYIESSAVYKDKLYVCGREIYSTPTDFQTLITVTPYNSSFYFQRPFAIGNFSLITDSAYSCGPIIVDDITEKVWKFFNFETQPNEGLSLYLLDSTLKKLVLKFPTENSIFSMDINNNVVVLNAGRFIYVFDLPEAFVNGQIVEYSAMLQMESSEAFIQIHDWNEEIYYKEDNSKIFNIYERSKNTLKLIDTYVLPSVTDDKAFYAMSFLPNRTHGYLQGASFVYKFPIPRYDQINMSTLNLPSFQTLSLLLLSLLFILI